MGTPEQALEIEETLKGLNLRFFMVAKGMVALLLATMQADRIMLYAGHSVPVVVDLFHWGLVALLLVLFLTFLSQASRLKIRT